MVSGALPWIAPALDALLTGLRGLHDSLQDEDGLQRQELLWAQMAAAFSLCGAQVCCSLADELRQLAGASARGAVSSRWESLWVSTRGLAGIELQLRRYRDGSSEAALALMGLIDDARAARKLALLSGETLFLPGLDKPVPPRLVAHLHASAEEPDEAARQLRPRYQAALTVLAEDPVDTDAAESLYAVTGQILNACDSAEGKRLWWFAAGLSEALKEGWCAYTPAVRSLAQRLEPEIARLAILGEARFAHRQPRTLLRNLLFRIALIPGTQGIAGSIKRAYLLEEFLPGTARRKAGEDGFEPGAFDALRHRAEDILLRLRRQVEALGRSRRYRPELYADMVEPLSMSAQIAAQLGEATASQQLDTLAQYVSTIATRQEAAHDRGLWTMAGVLFRAEKRVHALRIRQSVQTDEPRAPNAATVTRESALGKALQLLNIAVARLLPRPGAAILPARVRAEAVLALNRSSGLAARWDAAPSRVLTALAAWVSDSSETDLESAPFGACMMALACMRCRLDSTLSGRRYPRDPLNYARAALEALGIEVALDEAAPEAEAPNVLGQADLFMTPAPEECYENFESLDDLESVEEPDSALSATPEPPAATPALPPPAEHAPGFILPLPLTETAPAAPVLPPPVPARKRGTKAQSPAAEKPPAEIVTESLEASLDRLETLILKLEQRVLVQE